MTYKITYSKDFKKHYKKLSEVEKKQTKKKIKFFVENPTHPSLRTKKIQGTDGIWESSVNMDIRIIWFYENNELIFLLDIGHHDILDKFWADESEYKHILFHQLFLSIRFLFTIFISSAAFWISHDACIAG